MNNFAISQAGIEAIKMFEGFKAKAYFCPAGVATIGYGHIFSVTKKDVKTGKTISKEQAEELLRKDLSFAEKTVNKEVKVALNQAQFDVLVSFVFNIGSGAFKRSTLLKKLNKGQYETVPTELMRWVHGGGRILSGLVNRRRKEADMFEKASHKTTNNNVSNNNDALPKDDEKTRLVDEPVKPLIQSRTLWAATTIQLAALSGFISELQGLFAQGSQALKLAQNMGKYSIISLFSIILMVSLFSIYIRISDSRKKRK